MFLAGAQLRRNCEQSIVNSIFIGWNAGSVNALLIDGSKGVPTDLNLEPNAGLSFRNNIIAGPNSNAISYAASSTAATGATKASITNWVNTPSYLNTLLNDNADVNLIAPFNYSNPDFNPASSSSPAASGASFSISKLATGFLNVTYRGACNVGDTWWKGWTKFSLQ